MKIGIITNNITGNGGIETVLSAVFNSVSRYPAFKFELFLNSAVMRTDWQMSVGKLVSIVSGNHKEKIARFLDSMTYLIKTDADELIVMSTKLLPIVVLVKKIFHKKYKIVSWIHFSLKDSIFSHPEWVRMADYHLAISSGIANQIEELGVDPQQIFTIYNPVVLPSDCLIPRPADKKLNLVYIGRIQFEDQKNIKELLDGLSQVQGDWQIKIFGNGTDEAKCQAYARELGLQDRIQWCGWHDNPWESIQTCSGLVLTSNYEGFPMVLVEAMGHGVPCVSSNCLTGPDDIIKSGSNGFLYQLGDSRALATALTRLENLTSNPKEVAASVYPFREAEYFKKFYSALVSIAQ